MTIHEILNNQSRRQQEFPVAAERVFLSHAGVCPLPRCVSAAMRAYLEQAMTDNQEDFMFGKVVPETRRLAARLIEAEAGEIAFVGSTSMGLAMVAAGLPWQAGDNVICYQEDYPANVYPWMDLATRGVSVRFVEPRQYGRPTVEDLEPLIDDRTRLVSLASAHFVSGWRLDVDRIGKFLQEHGVLFCLDGIQTFGALRTSCRHVDFAAADAHKWMLGPLGAAILYVRQQHLDLLRPPLVGWSSAACPGFIAQDELRFWPDARRYEPGTLNLAGVVGLKAALEMLLGIGLEPIENRVRSLARLAVAGARDCGYRVLGPADGNELTGIVSLTNPDRDLAGIHRSLVEQGIAPSLRQKRDGTAVLRISAHFYNTEAEIARTISHL